jgi:predicted DNA-binding protein YlxM (UPF0122 family)
MRRPGHLSELGAINQQIKRCRAYIEAAENRLAYRRDKVDEKLARDTLLTYNASLLLLLRVRSIVRTEVEEESRSTLG